MAKQEKYMRVNGTDPFEGVDMNAIRILRGCRDSKQSLAAGKTYKVPGQVSLDDAKTLVSIGKAMPVSGTAPKAENREKELAASKSKRGTIKGNKK